MENRFSRTQMLLGTEAMDRIKGSRVAVFGIGGVGGYVTEALARSGVGALDLIDGDVVSESNLNRQIIATDRTVGLPKTLAAKERILSINPECMVTLYDMFFLPDNSASVDFSSFDYAVDAIDTVAGKLEIVRKAKEAGIPVISSMGTGNKMEVSMLEVADISKTSVCPLARVMRKKLREMGIENLKVVYSKELPLKPLEGAEETSGRQVPGSNAFVPAAAGLMIAGEVIKDLAGYGR